MTLEEKLDSGKLIIVDARVFKKMQAMSREDIRKGICSAADIRYILDMSENTLYEHMKDNKDCLIVPSKLKGKYKLSSVYDELERLNS